MVSTLPTGVRFSLFRCTISVRAAANGGCALGNIWGIGQEGGADGFLEGFVCESGIFG